MGESDLIYILAILLQAGILVFFIARGKRKGRTQPQKKEETFATEYERLRHTALQVTPAQLGLDIPANTLRVYGVVMDWDMNGVILTLSAYINGAANAYLSSGASAMGSGKNPVVAEQASEFVQVAQDYIGRVVPVAATGLPAPGTVRFYLLTNHGIYAAQEQLHFIDDNSSPWLGLFFRGNMVINEIKATA